MPLSSPISSLDEKHSTTNTDIKNDTWGKEFIHKFNITTDHLLKQFFKELWAHTKRPRWVSNQAIKDGKDKLFITISKLWMEWLEENIKSFPENDDAFQKKLTEIAKQDFYKSDDQILLLGRLKELCEITKGKLKQSLQVLIEKIKTACGISDQAEKSYLKLMQKKIEAVENEQKQKQLDLEKSAYIRRKIFAEFEDEVNKIIKPSWIQSDASKNARAQIAAALKQEKSSCLKLENHTEVHTAIENVKNLMQKLEKCINTSGQLYKNIHGYFLKKVTHEVPVRKRIIEARYRYRVR